LVVEKMATMAMTQTATRSPGGGPSWDEEVVPTLRKREHPYFLSFF
jgi:hypothetical protein